MPVTREVLIERVRYLRDLQRSLEGALKESVAIAVAGPILNVFLKYPLVFLAIIVGDALLALTLSIQILKLRSRIESVWAEVMKDPEKWTRPWWLIGVAAVFIASIIALILTW